MTVAARSALTQRWLSGIRASLERYPAFGTPAPPDGAGDLQARVGSRFWYHTLELPGGIVTPGIFDHRPIVGFYGLPDDLQGKTVLDVGTWDGFWAFEFERRGARVTALDLEGLSDVDLPHAYRRALDHSGLQQYYGNGFGLAHEALSSSVTRLSRSVYELDPSTTGTFDVVHVGDVLLHLECPTKALRALRGVTTDLAIITNPFDPELAGDAVRYRGGWWDGVWWTSSLDTLGQMVLDAGFSGVTVRAAYQGLDTASGEWSWWAVIHATP